MPQDDPTIISGSWDPDSGEGTIWIRADFFSQDRIVQLDALQDWIADLTNTYDQLLSHPGSAVGVWLAAALGSRPRLTALGAVKTRLCVYRARK